MAVSGSDSSTHAICDLPGVASLTGRSGDDSDQLLLCAARRRSDMKGRPSSPLNPGQTVARGTGSQSRTLPLATTGPDERAGWMDPGHGCHCVHAHTGNARRIRRVCKGCRTPSRNGSAPRADPCRTLDFTRVRCSHSSSAGGGRSSAIPRQPHRSEPRSGGSRPRARDPQRSNVHQCRGKVIPTGRHRPVLTSRSASRRSHRHDDVGVPTEPPPLDPPHRVTGPVRHRIRDPMVRSTMPRQRELTLASTPDPRAIG